MALSDAECYVDGVGDREPVDGLKDEREVQSLFEFDDNPVFIASNGDCGLRPR